MEPTIGQIVHYQSYGTPGGEYLPLPRVAIITEVTENLVVEKPECECLYGCVNCSDAAVVGGTVGLCILNPTGIFFTKAPYSEVPKPGHWSWPPRV